MDEKKLLGDKFREMKIIITENQYNKIKDNLISEAETTAGVGAYKSPILGLIRGKMAYEVKMKDVGEKKRHQEEMIVYNPYNHSDFQYKQITSKMNKRE